MVHFCDSQLRPEHPTRLDVGWRHAHSIMLKQLPSNSRMFLSNLEHGAVSSSAPQCSSVPLAGPGLGAG